MIDLGTLGGDWASAHGVNSFGQTVGWSTLTGDSGVEHAFLYEGGRMVDLNTLIGDHVGLTLEAAMSVNAGGQILVERRRDGNDRAYLLTPATATVPEPSVPALPGIATAAAGLRRGVRRL